MRNISTHLQERVQVLRLIVVLLRARVHVRKSARVLVGRLQREHVLEQAAEERLLNKRHSVVARDDPEVAGLDPGKDVSV